MEDRVGRQIGNYRLLRQLGHGGFADVYLGEHRYLKNYAALKILRATLSDEQVASFMVEAQMLARLAHPQIVRVLDFLVEHGTAVLIMDYAPGGTMRQHHPLGTRLPLERTVSYVRHIAMALQYAHNRDVIHLEVQDLRAVIERPALLPDVQLTFEENLIGDLLFESYGQANVLPLLEFTLDQLFQFREDHRLTFAAYQQIGGVKGALAKQAEDTYISLPSEEHRRLARVLFLRLIDPGMNEQVSTRRRAAFSELAFPDAQQTTIIHQAIDAFVTARLLTINQIASITTVEISHEALIRAWVRLSDWLREGSEDAHLQQIISEDAVEWERRGKSKDRLYRGSQLAEASVWASRNMLSQSEQSFIRASVQQQRRGRITMIASILLLVLIAGLLFQFVQEQLAPQTIVRNMQDGSANSLRAIIEKAPPGSTITFADGVKGLLTLTGDLDIKQSLTIAGPGKDVVTISGGTDGFRVKIEPTANVSISGMSFEHTSNLTSGFIYNVGQLTLTDTTISDNSSGNVDPQKGFGGGISNFGVLTINHSLISHNQATKQGGGISNYGMLTLNQTTVSDNRITASKDTTVTGDGGGIYTGPYGPLKLIDSTISGNTATGSGGGIADGGLFSGGPLTLIRSVVSGNTALENGGGISDYGQFAAFNSTIANNTASQNGGGLFVGSSSSKNKTSLTFCTFYGNTANGDGGAIFQATPLPSTAIQLTACIVAGNRAATHASVTGMIASSGYNLLQDKGNLTFTADGPANTDLGTEDGQLTSIFTSPVQLQKNGGTTETYALLPNAANPALDKVPLSVCSSNGITTDQRDSKRPDGNEHFCDIGAYEAN